MPAFELHCGDCLNVLPTLGLVDAIVTDPPYGLSFMGKGWDHAVPSVEIWRECLRVLKPGGYLLAFAGTRTQHRMACAIEDAGFEIRDMIAWVYGTGFPKSLNVSKAIDKVAPEAAKQWEGWGTALKPALEPITVARKPLEGTVAANVQKHGVGAINVDACRVEANTSEFGSGGGSKVGSGAAERHDPTSFTVKGKVMPMHAKGRFPANLIHDGSEEATELFPTAGGGDKRTTAAGKRPGGFANVGSDNGAGGNNAPAYNDSGSAARFFYCAKASKKERNAGLENLPLKTADPYGEHRGRRMDDNNTRIDGKPASKGQNNHPTVKPLALMQYLCRLVTPPGGTVLDPFTGSGSTGIAALQEGFGFIGIELSEEYHAIALQRIEAVVAPKDSDSPTRQGSLF